MLRFSLARPTLLVALLFAGLTAVAQSPAPTFTITTSNVSLSPTGTGSIPYTLTSVNGYIGTVVLNCGAPVVPAGVRIPYCGSAPVVSYTLTANQVVTGNFPLYGNVVTLPGGLIASHNPMLAIFFIVALLSGLTLRRHTARRLTLPLFLAVLAALCCTTGCGNIPQGFTPGTYTYVVSATQSPVPLSLSANATVAIH
jgi:hypothetical protein